jgi:hypothetical protein
MREREFLRWKKKTLGEKSATSSAETVARVCTKATSLRSTGAKNASNDGDLRLRNDENIAAVAIHPTLRFFFLLDRRRKPNIEEIQKTEILVCSSVKPRNSAHRKTMKQSQQLLFVNVVGFVVVAAAVVVVESSKVRETEREWGVFGLFNLAESASFERKKGPNFQGFLFPSFFIYLFFLSLGIFFERRLHCRLG